MTFQKPFVDFSGLQKCKNFSQKILLSSPNLVCNWNALAQALLGPQPGKICIVCKILGALKPQSHCSHVTWTYDFCQESLNWGKPVVFSKGWKEGGWKTQAGPSLLNIHLLMGMKYMGQTLWGLSPFFPLLWLCAFASIVILVTFLSDSSLGSQTWSSDSLDKNLALVWLRT